MQLLEMLEDMGQLRSHSTSARAYRHWKVMCPLCSSTFVARAGNIKRGITTRCARCSKKEVGIRRMLRAASDFEVSAINVHGNRYDYGKVVYRGNKVPVEIHCKLHGAFMQAPVEHILERSNCPTCAGGFSRHLPAILYYFKICNVWKVGVTNKTINTRYNSRDCENITDIITWEFSTGAEAYKYEQLILKSNSAFRYNGVTPFTDGTLTTECFTEDIYLKSLS